MTWRGSRTTSASNSAARGQATSGPWWVLAHDGEELAAQKVRVRLAVQAGRLLRWGHVPTSEVVSHGLGIDLDRLRNRADRVPLLAQSDHDG